jgi:hypothetical protein
MYPYASMILHLDKFTFQAQINDPTTVKSFQAGNIKRAILVICYHKYKLFKIFLYDFSNNVRFFLKTELTI